MLRSSKPDFYKPSNSPGPNCPDAVLDAYEKCKDANGDLATLCCSYIYLHSRKHIYVKAEDDPGGTRSKICSSSIWTARNNGASPTWWWQQRQNRPKGPINRGGGWHERTGVGMSRACNILRYVKCRIWCRSTATKTWSTTLSAARHLASMNIYEVLALKFNDSFRATIPRKRSLDNGWIILTRRASRTCVYLQYTGVILSYAP